MVLETNNHSVFSLNYHLILCTKYRRNVITDVISDRLQDIFQYIAPTYNITLDEWNHNWDYIHVLFRGQPNTNISKFLNAYKSASSRLVKRDFPEVRNHLWNGMFWSQSFCLISTGGASIDVIREYIRTQGERHGREKRGKSE